MQLLKIIFAVLGRILLSAIFIIAGLNKILNWEGTKNSLLEALGKWHGYQDIHLVDRLIDFFTNKVDILLWMATSFELLGGLLVLIGIFTRFGALLLSLFIIPATLLYHSFWTLSDPERDIQLVMFMKNMAILGGLMIVLAFGSGFSKSSSMIKEPFE